MSEQENTQKSTKTEEKSLFAKRFRGYFPVVVDVETAGFNAQTDALLELAATTLSLDEETGLFSLDETVQYNIEPLKVQTWNHLLWLLLVLILPTHYVALYPKKKH